MIKRGNFFTYLRIFNNEAATYIFFLVILLFVKAMFIFLSGPLPDEAYYWLWSKKLAFSYYDHPPLSMWVQGLISNFIPSKQIQIRIVPLISFIAILALNIHWMRLIGINNTLDKIKSCLMLISIPLYSIFLTVSFPDATLIFLIFLSGFYFYKFIREFLLEENKYIYWYISILTFSFACITKYNAVIFGVGVVIFLMIRKDLRKILLSPHFLIGVLIFLLIQSPVIIWNIQNDFASLNFNLNSRLDFDFSWLIFLLNLTIFLIAVILTSSPVFFLAILNWKNIRVSSYTNTIFLNFCYILLICTFLFCITLSVFTTVLYYWAIIAFILFFPFLSSIITNRIHVFLHALYGLLIMTSLLINSTFYPLSAFWGEVDRETAILYGWKDITEIVSEIKEKNDVKNVLFTDYRLASLYSFHSEDYFSDAIMENRETQFDIWRKGAENQNQRVIIICDEDFPLHKKIFDVFSVINYKRSINVYSQRKKIKTYSVYFAKT